MTITSFIALVWCVLLMEVCVLSILRAWRFSGAKKIAFAGGIFLCLLIPIGNISVAELMRGYTGDLSITSAVLLIGALWYILSGKRILPRNQLQYLAVCSILAALFLYPFGLGIAQFDSYALGFNNPCFVIGLGMFTLIALIARQTLTVWCVLLGVSAYLLGLYESDNVWDYLIDPFVVVFAVSMGVKYLFVWSKSCIVRR